MAAPKILLIYTGGTIGMVADAETGALKPLDFRQIESEIPALKRLDVELEYFEGSRPIDSSDVTPDDWIELAETIRRNYEAFDGFVVLHGTDTMAWSASALSFMFENLAKPVVFTGSQIPIGVLRTDGRENLVTAVEIAASGRVPEVSIYFQNRLFRANRTTKWSAEQLNAFTSENYPPLAEVGVSIHYNDAAIASVEEATEELRVSTRLCRDVAIVRLFPGLQKKTFEAMLAVPDLKGVVLQTFGSGNAPTTSWFLDAIERAIRRGVVIVNVTQCIAGGTQPLYESGIRLGNLGVILGRDMTGEAALVKLMYVLGHSETPVQVSLRLNSSLRGEFTE